MTTSTPFIDQQDPQVAAALHSEETRQAEGLELIPSENYVSRAVLEAGGSVFTNKYSEGYPGRRYYGGQDFTDAVERLAIERACQLFNCKYANVQPISGAVANVGMYFALLQPGDTILGMDLSHGGHLTHGHPVTHIAKIFNFVRYKMADPESAELDYDHLRKMAQEHRPKMILAGFSAYPKNLDYARFRAIADEVGAICVADMAHIAGLIAGKALRNPFDDGFDVITTTTHKTLRGPRGGMILTRESEEIAKKIDKSMFPGLQGGPLMHLVAGKAVCFQEALQPSFQTYAQQVIKNAAAMAEFFRGKKVRMIGGGTENHLILMDVFSSFGITGQQAETALDEVGITLNKNSVADDPRPPLDPSGIRFGTPAITTRGFDEADCAEVARLMFEVMEAPDSEAVKSEAKQVIRELALKNPVPERF